VIGFRKGWKEQKVEKAIDPNKPHIITRAQIEYIFMCLRHIGRAVQVLEAMKDRSVEIEGIENLLVDLRETADRIYTTIRETPEVN
jgi:hypothetical protein